MVMGRRGKAATYKEKKKTEKNFPQFQLANKKAKQSIMSGGPHSLLLLPGGSGMKSDKTRICKLAGSFWISAGVVMVGDEVILEQRDEGLER